MWYDWGMKKETVNTLCFTPFDLVKGQENFYKSLLVIISILTLPGCLASDTSAPLAPKPPEISITTMEDPVFVPHYFSDPALVDPLTVGVGAEVHDTGFEERLEPVSGAPAEAKIALAEDKCRVQDRFDRKAVLAYEWGYQRIGLDVDGIGFGGSDDAGVKLEYKMNLQRKKNEYQKCRYNSKWQGLIGSGYNELFLREDGAMWKDLRDMRKDVSDYIDNTL